MGALTADMQRVVRGQRLGYVATVCPDGTPNLVKVERAAPVTSPGYDLGLTEAELRARFRAYYAALDADPT